MYSPRGYSLPGREYKCVSLDRPPGSRVTGLPACQPTNQLPAANLSPSYPSSPYLPGAGPTGALDKSVFASFLPLSIPSQSRRVAAAPSHPHLLPGDRATSQDHDVALALETLAAIHCSALSLLAESTVHIVQRSTKGSSGLSLTRGKEPSRRSEDKHPHHTLVVWVVSILEPGGSKMPFMFEGLRYRRSWQNHQDQGR